MRNLVQWTRGHATHKTLALFKRKTKKDFRSPSLQSLATIILMLTASHTFLNIYGSKNTFYGHALLRNSTNR